MPFTQDLKQSFSSGVRSRGSLYQQYGQVDVYERDATHAVATVESNYGAEYSVSIEWSGAPYRPLVVRCTCPHFSDGELCKHIWATLLELDRLGVRPPGRGRLPLRLDADFQGELDADLYECFDEEVPAKSSEPVPPWRRAFQHVHDLATQSRDESPNGRSKRLRAYFIINLANSIRQNALLIDFYCREPRINGQLGKVKQLKMSHALVGSFADEQDRQLLELLVGNESNLRDAKGAPDFYGYEYSARCAFESVRLPASHYEFLLPKMCRDRTRAMPA